MKLLYGLLNTNKSDLRWLLYTKFTAICSTTLILWYNSIVKMVTCRKQNSTKVAIASKTHSLWQTDLTYIGSVFIYIFLKWTYLTSQLIRFARVCNHVTDFNARNKCLTAKLLQQGYWYHKLRKTFSKFYRRHNELISKYI